MPRHERVFGRLLRNGPETWMPQSEDLVMPTTGDLILKLAAEYPSWSNGRIADEVRRHRPDARTTAASVSSTKSRAKGSDAAGGTGCRQGSGRSGTRALSSTANQDLVVPSINDLVLKLWRENPSWSNDEIADEVRRRKPGARTTAASVSSTKSRARAPRAAARPGDGRERRWSDPSFRVPREIDPGELLLMIESGESAMLEFKSTARRNLRTGEPDQKMVTEVVKTIAGFMNSEGGRLLIGVDDGGRPIGIEEDYDFVKRPKRDSWELWLTDAVTSALGQVAATDIEVRFGSWDDRTIACIDVSPGAEPVFASVKGEQRRVFFARINNSTRELWDRELLAYQQKHWR